MVWTPDGKVRNLGSHGGFDSEATLIDDIGEVAGWVENTTPDEFSFGDGAETQAFVWRNGEMRLLGTLKGGTDSSPFALNDFGQVVGCSTTSTTTAPTFNFAPFTPVLWQKGSISDLGNLGGLGGCAASINNESQIVGYSDLAGDMHQHAFLWEHGRLNDLGTIGGPDSGAFVINDVGEVIGTSDLPGPDPIFHAVLWRNGHIIDLKTLSGDTCSQALGINSRGQVVGSSGPCDFDDGFGQHHATLWNGTSLVDLNSFIPVNSGIVLVWAFMVDDFGEIEGFGILPNGDSRAFILIPQYSKDGVRALTTPTTTVTPEVIGVRASIQAGIGRLPTSSATASRRTRQARLARGFRFMDPH